MNTLKTLAMGMVVMMLTAGFAGAETLNADINNGAVNTAIGTGGEANQKQKQKMKQRQEQEQSIKDSANVKDSGNASLNNVTQREFLGLPTGPTLMAVTVIPETKGCIPISFQEFSLKEISNMNAGSFLEKKGGWFHGMFSSRVKPSVRIPFEGKEHHTGPIFTLDWDVTKGFKLYDGDKKLGSFNCEGDYGYPLDATLGMCLADAFEQTNMTEVYACYTVRTDSHSSGTAYQGGGGASGVADDVGASGMVSGTFGTSVAYANKAYDVELIAVKLAEVKQTYAPKSAPTPQPAPIPKVCDEAWLLRQIRIWEEACIHCGTPCFNNEMLRYNMGNYYMALYDCTSDKKYLRLAIEEYDKGERDCLNGKEPDGTRTRTMKGAQTILYNIRYNKSFAIRILYSVKAQHGYAKQNSLSSVPTSYADIRR